jgi:predicted CXXCH cytochrome family protein
MNRQIRNKLTAIFSFMAIITGIALHVTAADKKEIPEYIGSQACLPCHADKYVSWKSSNHAQMVVPIINSSNLPLDIASAPANLQAELRKAVYMVANSFFLERDPATQHYKLLGVSFDKAAKAYKPSGVNLDWSTSCAGCHTTNMNTPNLTWGEAGIGCEACHGPGRNHALNKGDISKIVASKDADICGQCHGGNDVQTGGKLMSDGTKWVVGFRPGMKLSTLPGIQLTPVDPKKIPPDSDISANHLRNFNMWEASGHSKALSRIVNNSQATADCYGCHSAEGFAAKLQGKKVDIAQKGSFNTLSCVACHDPHNSDNPRQLVVEANKLCVSCHTQEAVLKGQGARGIEDIRSVHSAVSCVSCHMTEGNHLMKVIRPDDPDLSEKRADTCTACHKDNNRKGRAEQLHVWQAEYKEKMDALQADVNSVSAALKEKPDLLNAELKKKFGDLRFNLSILTRDRSQSAHNLDYALEIMAAASRDLKELKVAVK